MQVYQTLKNLPCPFFYYIELKVFMLQTESAQPGRMYSTLEGIDNK